jgi:hypothetical protein
VTVFDLEAPQVDPRRVVLTAVAGLLFAVGWSARKTLIGVATAARRTAGAVVWCATAVKVGWQQARATDHI